MLARYRDLMRREGRGWRAAGCAVAASVVLAGCSSTTPGNPQPSTVATVGASTTAKSKPRLTLPPRPATLSVAGIDPCKLVPQDKKAELGIDRPAASDPSVTNSVMGGKFCSYSVVAWGVYGFDVSDTYSAQKWINHSVAAANRLVEVEGYPTVLTYSSDRAGGCVAVVDISDTAVLGLSVIDRRDYTAADGKVVCANALKAARVALTALRGMQK